MQRRGRAAETADVMSSYAHDRIRGLIVGALAEEPPDSRSRKGPRRESGRRAEREPCHWTQYWTRYSRAQPIAPTMVPLSNPDGNDGGGGRKEPRGAKRKCQRLKKEKKTAREMAEDEGKMRG